MKRPRCGPAPTTSCVLSEQGALDRCPAKRRRRVQHGSHQIVGGRPLPATIQCLAITSATRLLRREPSWEVGVLTGPPLAGGAASVANDPGQRSPGSSSPRSARQPLALAEPRGAGGVSSRREGRATARSAVRGKCRSRTAQSCGLTTSVTLPGGAPRCPPQWPSSLYAGREAAARSPPTPGAGLTTTTTTMTGPPAGPGGEGKGATGLWCRGGGNNAHGEPPPPS
eukprot:scaffold3600_cov387-Prasinococcus_capsulatus_cf.AAC.19